jgi:2-phospho-L-lactate/phosphoenolpyruvate guanylyltransferase
MDVHVLVPLKATDPKSRLADALSAEERRDLMRALLDHVVGVVRAAGVAGATVVTGEPLEGHDVWPDPGLEWNEALAAAARDLVTAPLVAFVSADLPRLQADEVRQLVEATPERGIAIGRAQDGGTNAIAMRPPGLVLTHFGEPQSASVHASLGVPFTMVDLPGLAFDIDTPEDLAKWH